MVLQSSWLYDSVRRRASAAGDTVRELGDISLAVSFVVWRVQAGHGVVGNNLRASVRCPGCPLGADVCRRAGPFLYALDLFLCAADVLSERVRASPQDCVRPG